MPTVHEMKTPFKPDAYSRTKVVTMGNITELITCQKPSTGGCPIRKIDKDHYEDMRTGELKEYKHIENRSESLKSIKHTLERIRALINTNVTKPDNVRWVTLTYAENMTDTRQLYEDYFRFWKRFTYWCKKNGHTKPEYITVQEPQGRGAWHIHAFFIWPEKAPFISNDEVMARLWGHGFTKVKAMSNCDNVGAYFSAYLGDMALDEVEKLPEDERLKALSSGIMEDNEFTDEQDRTKTKKFVKGGRLYLYPAGMNIVRSTKGIKQPVTEIMTHAEAKEKVRSAKQTFSRAYEILDDDGEVINRICKSYYNFRRA